MDRRLMERRRRVAEERARSNLGRLVRILAILGLVAVALWFAQSPFLSVGSITVRGADRVDVLSVLDAHGVVEGRPLLLLDVGGAEQSLREDPWVEAASVARQWPTGVVVELEERTPAARAVLGDGAWLVAGDGVLLQPAADATALPTVQMPDLDPDGAGDDLDLQGAVEYLASLPQDYREGAVVRKGEEGLEATVAGFAVRLGGPFDSAEKASVTAALLDAGVEEGAILTVVAPASPAVLPADATTPPSTDTTAP
ncbi:MAG: cell division protein FtsQ/DivIB [Actinomycetota bacterium]